MVNLMTMFFKFATEGDEDIRRVLEDLKKGGKDAEKAFDGLAETITGLVSGLAALKTVEIGRQFVAEFADAEQQSTRLAAAIEGIGQNYSALKPRIDSTVESLMRLTTLEDDQASAALANLVTITSDFDKSLRALAVAQDLAARKGMDLESAAQLIGRAIMGNTGMLSRYGIFIKEGTDALDALEKKTRGAAEAQAQTLGGAIEQVNVQLGNLREGVGETISEMLGLRSIAQAVSRGLLNMSDSQRTLLTSLIVAGGVTVTVAAGFRAIAAALQLVNAAMTAGGAASLLGSLKDPRLIAALTALAAIVGVLSYNASKASAELQEAAVSFGKMSSGQLQQEKKRLESEVKALEAQYKRDMARYGASLIYDELEQAQKKLAAVTEELTKATERDAVAAEISQQKKQQAAIEAAAKAEELRLLEEAQYATRLKLLQLSDLSASALSKLTDEASAYEKAAARANATDEERLRLLQRAADLRNVVTEKGTVERVTLGGLTANVATPVGFNPAAELYADDRKGGVGKLPFEQQVDESRKAMASLEEVKVDLDQIISDIQNHITIRTIEMREQLATELRGAFIDTFSDAIVSGIREGFAGGGVAGAFKAAGRSILSGLGSIFVSMGRAMVAASPLFTSISAAMSNPLNPAAGIALAVRGAALMALGATLGAIAHNGAGASSAGGGNVAQGMQFGYRMPQVATPSSAISFGPSTSVATASTAVQTAGLTVNVIGTDDPRAQREILELINKANRRGLL